MADMTEAQRAAYEAGLKRAQEAAAVPTQRVRSMAQGVSFGTSDEIEARLRAAATGRPYEEVLNEIRGGLKAYQEANPLSSLGYEAAGAAIPALVGAVFTGGTSTGATGARLLPRALQAAKVAAVQGGLYGFGTGEGGIGNRATGAVGGALGGAVAGPVVGEAFRAASIPASGFIDFARRRLGNRGSSAVENELQRIANSTGRPIDEIVNDVANGRILAENRTLLDTVRAYRSLGGPAATDIQNVLTQRAEEGRQAAMTQMQSGLSNVSDPNVRRGIAAAQRGERAAERDAYAPFKTIPADEDVTSALADALRRVPSAADEVATALRAETGSSPFFSIAEDGTVSFSRQPTVAEAETVRRAIKNRATQLFGSSQGTAGEAISGVESELRSALDAAVPELADVRATASAVRSAADAFKFGQGALSRSPDQVAIDFGAAQDAGPQAVAAFRAGVMDAYRNRMSTGSRASMMGNLSNPDRREGAVLRMVFPQDQLQGILRTIENAAASQEAKGHVLGGSPTTPTEMAVRNVGSGIGASDIAAVMGGDVIATTRALTQMIGALKGDLTPQERQRVASILLEVDPQIVRRALMDESGMASLQRALEDFGRKAAIGARGAAIPAASGVGSNIANGLLAQ